MKSFIVKLTLFIVLTGSIVAGLILLSDLAIKQRKQQLLQISEDINMVFTGDSKVESAVDDNLIANAINIAQSGEAYLYSYVKIRSLIECNDQIKIIFIGFSPENFLMETEEKWLFGDISVIEKIKSYNYLLNYSDKSLIIKHNSEAYLKGLTKSIFRNILSYFKTFSSKDINGRPINFGGYSHLERDKLQQDIKIMNLNKENSFEKSLIQERYLRMISELCRQKSVKLILLNTPRYKYYNMNINEQVWQNWLSVRNSLAGDSLMDFSTFSLPDSCFGDLSHLNYKGAELFSQYLNELLH